MPPLELRCSGGGRASRSCRRNASMVRFCDATICPGRREGGGAGEGERGEEGGRGGGALGRGRRPSGRREEDEEGSEAGVEETRGGGSGAISCIRAPSPTRLARSSDVDRSAYNRESQRGSEEALGRVREVLPRGASPSAPATSAFSSRISSSRARSCRTSAFRQPFSWTSAPTDAHREVRHTRRGPALRRAGAARPAVAGAPPRRREGPRSASAARPARRRPPAAEEAAPGDGRSPRGRGCTRRGGRRARRGLLERRAAGVAPQCARAAARAKCWPALGPAREATRPPPPTKRLFRPALRNVARVAAGFRLRQIGGLYFPSINQTESRPNALPIYLSLGRAQRGEKRRKSGYLPIAGPSGAVKTGGPIPTYLLHRP